MCPPDHDEPRSPARPADPWPSEGRPADVRRTERYVRRNAEPTIQRRVNRRTGEMSVDGPAARRQTPHAGPSPKSGIPSRVAAIAVLLAVIVIFVIAALVATSGSDAAPGSGETVPVSALPITPAYLKEGAATSTTEYPETFLNMETPVPESALSGEDGGTVTTTTTAGD